MGAKNNETPTDSVHANADPAGSPASAISYFIKARGAQVKLDQVHASTEGVRGQEALVMLAEYQTHLTDTIRDAADMIMQSGGVDAIMDGAASMIEGWSKI